MAEKTFNQPDDLYLDPDFGYTVGVEDVTGVLTNESIVESSFPTIDRLEAEAGEELPEEFDVVEFNSLYGLREHITSKELRSEVESKFNDTIIKQFEVYKMEYIRASREIVEYFEIQKAVEPRLAEFKELLAEAPTVYAEALSTVVDAESDEAAAETIDQVLAVFRDSMVAQRAQIVQARNYRRELPGNLQAMRDSVEGIREAIAVPFPSDRFSEIETKLRHTEAANDEELEGDSIPNSELQTSLDIGGFIEEYKHMLASTAPAKQGIKARLFGANK